MRSIRIVAVALAALATVLVSIPPVFADGGRHWRHRHHHGHHHGHRHHAHGSRLHFGFAFGGPVFGGPLWYPAPVYAYPPAVIVPPAPRVYIEREDRVAQESAPGYWYYCRESNTYYPYVKECAGPWERVPAQPLNR